MQTVSENGEVENQYDYDIFGNATLTVETEYTNAIRYAGEFFDAEVGLYYLRARYYNPYTGRFISEDSYWGEDVNPLSLNQYTYAHNNPIQFIDPSGHFILNIIGVVIGNVVEAIGKAVVNQISEHKQEQTSQVSSNNNNDNHYPKHDSGPERDSGEQSNKIIFNQIKDVALNLLSSYSPKGYLISEAIKYKLSEPMDNISEEDEQEVLANGLTPLK